MSVVQGAAFGFSTIAERAGEQLTPHLSKIVPRLYRYTFDPNVKIQTAMRGIWNAVVKDSKLMVGDPRWWWVSLYPSTRLNTIQQELLFHVKDKLIVNWRSFLI